METSSNLFWAWGWIWWAISGGWPVVAAIPGIVAFCWQWRDRKAKQEAQTPYIRVEDGSSTGLRGPWRPIRIYIRNDSPFPIHVTSISVKSPLALARLDGENEADSARAGETLQLSLRVNASGENHTYGFVGSTLRSKSQVQLSMRAQYSEMSASRRTRIIKVTSEPISVPQITVNKSN